MSQVYRIAIIASHPIQYQAPWFRALARVTDLTVFFCHQQDAAGQADAGFGVPFEWDVPLLDGYEYRWLKNRARRPDVSRPLGCDTPEIRAIIREGGFDACVVCGWYLKSYLQAIQACRRAGIPVFVRGDSQLGTPRSKFLNAAKYVPYRWMLQSVDGHLYVGQANREYLRHYGVADTQLFFTPHFVDNSFFRRTSAQARADGTSATIRISCGAGADVTLFVFVGKLIEKKRPGDFIRALGIARQRGANVRGLVVGSGPLGSEIEAMSRSLAVPVSFAGFRNQTELPPFLVAADALVLPSDGRETWGLVVNEAMACGLPAIVSRAAGCARDLIEERVTGYTFGVADTDTLSDHVMTLHTRLQQQPDAFRDAVRARIDQYDVSAAVHGTLSALDAIVGALPREDSPLRHSRGHVTHL